MKILFVCEGNVYRSQMAGTILRTLTPWAEVKTAGTLAENDGKRLADVSTRSIALMQELGYDMSDNMVTRLTPEIVEWADKVVLVGPTPGGPVPEYLKNSPKLEEWGIADPGYAMISPEDARDLIIAKVRELAKRLSEKLA